MTIKVDATSMQRALLWLVALFFLAHLVGQSLVQILGLRPDHAAVYRFNMNRERSVSTLGATLLLVSCAVCLLVIALAHRRRGTGEAPAWAGLGLVFLALALDETLSIHELASDPLRARFGLERDWLYVIWVVPAAVLLALLGLLYLPFLRRLDARWRRAFVGAGVVFLSGAIGMEVIGALLRTTWGDGFRYAVIAGAEEVLEMVGAILFLTALVRYLSHMVDDVRLDLRPSRG